MKVRRTSFYFLDHDIQKTVKEIRFCMEISSHKNEIQCHTETEPDSLLVKNVHESFTDKRKTNKNVTLQKYCYIVSHKNEIQCHIETEPDSLLVKNIHESFTDKRKTNKNVTRKKIATLCRIKAPHHAKSSDRDVARS